MILLFLAACGLPTPYPPQSLAHDSARIPGKALVHYLSQPGTVDARVCDPTEKGPHVARVDDEVIGALMTALDDGTLPPLRWQDCTRKMWPALEGDLRDDLLAAILDAFVGRLTADDQGSDAQRTLDVLATTLRERPRYSLPQAPMRAASQRLIAAHVPNRSRFVRLFHELELEANLYDGEPVDAARIEGMNDPVVLERMQQGLGDEALRQAARERWVAVLVDQTADPLVVAHREAVIASLLAHGHWALPESEWAFTEVRWDRGAPSALSELQVTWNPDGSEPDLTIRRADDSTVVPPIDVFFDASFVVGERALRACPYVLDMKVEPCVPASAFHTDAAHARFDGQARLTLTQDLDAAVLATFAAREDTSIPWSVGGLASAFDLPLFFDAPSDFVLQAAPGEVGPDLAITVRPEPNERVRFDIVGPEGSTFLVVEREALADLKVGSRGGQGSAGEAGMEGARGEPGKNGRNATCPGLTGTPGHPGLAGTDGGPGGRGGVGAAGGRVSVTVACDCPDLRAALESVVVAEGGPGGPGGIGGTGGVGGLGGGGGASAMCSEGVSGVDFFLPGGYDGPPGPSGDPGAPGPDGAQGPSGTVTFAE